MGTSITCHVIEIYLECLGTCYVDDTKLMFLHIHLFCIVKEFNDQL